jgi:hypothetical protein
MTGASTRTHAVSVSLSPGETARAEARALIDALPIGLAPELRSDLWLALSGMLTSRVLGVGAPEERYDLQVTADSGVVRCEIGTVTPQPRGGPAHAGLTVVDRIASRWGTSRHGRGVWFELDGASTD